MNSKKKKLLNETYHKFIQTSLHDFPLEGIEEFIDQKIMGFGTALDEKILSISEYRKLVIRQREQGKDIKMQFDIRPVVHKIADDGNSAVFVDEIILEMIIGNNTHKIFMRLSSVLEFRDQKWIVVHWHGSKPDYEEGESDSWHIHEWEKKNAELEKAVEEKTADLVIKNHELEIEASLERVRAIALSMKEPDDMLEVCKVISNQLQLLGIKDIRNVQTAIFNQPNKTYINYEYYKLHEKEIITEIDYTIHPKQMEWANEMLKSSDTFFATSFSGNDLKQWVENQRMSSQFVDSYLQEAESLNYYYYSIGPVAIGMSTYTSLNDEDLRIFKKFKNVFELSYKRFIDIEKAETQAKEAKIEAALERVRARAMGMQKPEDLSVIGKTIFSELKSLGFLSIRNTEMIINNNDKESVTSYHYSNYGLEEIIEINYKTNKIVRKWAEDLRKAEDAFVPVSIPDKEMKSWNKYRIELGYKSDPHMASAETVHYYSYSIGLGALSISTWQLLKEEQIKILERFKNVFKLSYKRYKDIAQAEAQAREAEIELALERVRARTMAMQKSKELKEVIQIVYEQFVQLNINIEHTGFIMDYKTRDDMNIWLADKNGPLSEITIPYFDSPHWNSFNEAKEKGINFFANTLNFKEKNKFYKKLFKFIPGLPEEAKEFYLSCQGLSISTVLLDNVGLYIENFSGISYSDEDNNTLMRFGKVFQQTYTRFLDLQKAEAQAREAQIEAALEKVRAIALGLRKSEDVGNVSDIFFNEFTKLSEDIIGSSIVVIDQKNDIMELWRARTNLAIKPFERASFNYMMEHIKKNIPDWYPEFYNALTEKENYLVKEVVGEDRNKFLKSVVEQYNYSNEEESRLFKMMPAKITAHFLFFDIGYFALISEGELPEIDLKIAKRFVDVFNFAYSRFLDIKKAEEQAREAHIEAALEKVRSRSLGMHKSDEIKDVVVTVMEKMNDLNINMNGGVSLTTFAPDSNDLIHWYVNPDHIDGPVTMHLPYFENVLFNDFVEARKSGKEILPVVYSFEEKNKYFEYAFEHSDFRIIHEDLKKWILEQPYFGYSVAIQKHSAIFFNDYSGKLFTKKENEVLLRFAKVFDQAYIRFLDLQKAEEQAREAQIEAALEKVRSRSLAMHTTNELGDVVFVIVEKLKDLGVVLDANGIVLCTYFDNSKDVLHWIVSPDFSFTGSYLLPYFEHPIFINAWESKLSGDEYFSKAYTIEEKNSFFEYAFEHSDYKHFPNEFKQWIFKNDKHILSFAWQKNSAILIPSHTGVVPSEDEVAILKRFAKVFEQSYVRFLDLKKAEAQARESQIEAGLERARAQSMMMQHSDELNKTSQVFHEQLRLLGIDSEFSYLWLPDEVKKEHLFWATWQEGTNGFKNKRVIYPLDKSEPAIAECYVAWESGMPVHVNPIPAAGVKEYFSTWSELLEGVDKFKPELYPDGLYYVDAYMKYGCFGIMIRKNLSDDEQQVLHRFSREFERAYTRFLDLQRAEAQARESQIEAALEKIRSHSLAMHKTDDLEHVVSVLFEQMQGLSIDMGFTSVSIFIFEEGSRNFYQWIQLPDKVMALSVPYFEHPISSDLFDAKESGADYLAKIYTVDEKNSWVEKGFELTDYKNLPKEFKTSLIEAPGYAISTTLSKNSGICIPSFVGKLPSEKDVEIMKRVGKVFEQAYIRFLDLQKAEAQARKAQIELSLERIRAQVTAMKESSDLLDIVVTMRKEFVSLGHEAHYFWHMRWLPDKYEKAMTSGDGTRIGMIMSLPRHIHGDIVPVAEWEKSDKPFHVLAMDVDTAVEYVDKMIRLGDFELVDPQAPSLDDIRHIGGLTFIMARTTHGEIGYSLPGTVPEPPKDAVNTLVRFAAVFDLAYKRFEDLKSSEHRQREAQIELALERVRARTMAMQKSNELAQTSSHLFAQLSELGINLYRYNIAIVNEELKNCRLWSTTKSGNVIPTSSAIPLSEYPVLIEMFEGWKTQRTNHKIKLEGKKRLEWTIYISKYLPFEEYKRENIDEKEILNNVAYFYNFYFKQGFFTIHSKEELTADQINIIQRFAYVFEQTFTRFLDLEKAERQNKLILAENERKSNELEEARQLQLAMLPKELPQLPNLDIAVYMKTATEVGGDYYDFHVDRSGVLTTVIGDATGHGMKAGTIVTITKSLFNSLASGKNILKVFSQISQVIRDMKFRQLSMCLMMLKISDNKLILSSAAMPPAFIFRKKENRAHEIVLNGMPLGALPNFPYKAEETTLNSGDTILLMSDGYPELMNDKGHMFGYEKALRLFEELAHKQAEEIINGLKNSASDWVQDKMPDDDVTFVVIKVK